MNHLIRSVVRLLTIGLAAQCICAAGLQAQDRTMDLSDLGRYVGLSSPALSPDGMWVAVVVSRVNYADNRFERSLVLVDAASGAQRALTGANENVGKPQWSPRGHQLAWLGSAEGGPEQIYLLSMPDQDTRAVRLTDVATGVQSFAWQPNAESIAFLSPEPRPVKVGEERHNQSFEVTDNDALATEPPVSSHVWLVPASGGVPRRLTAGTQSVTGIAWLRDGNTIAFASQPRPHNSPTDFAEFTHLSSKTNALKTIDREGGNQNVLVPDASIVSAPKVSPKGDLIAFVRFRGPERWTHPQNVAVVPTSGGAARDVTVSLDRDIQDFAWLPDGRGLLVAAPDGTQGSLWIQPLSAAARKVQLLPVVHLENLSVSESGAVAFIGSEAELPPELYVMNKIGKKPRRLTRFNAEIASRLTGRTETVRWHADGFEETGVLTYPPGYQAGRKIPLVLDIHGGPDGTSIEAFDIFDQILAARGWAVFKPNYRGSNSQGDAFQSAVINDLGDGPGRDVMAGVAAVKSRGFVDEKRLAVSGWSYGGYMTAWLLGHFDGWRVAVAGAPLVNYLDWYVMSCCNAWAQAVLGGSPWVHDNFARYWQQSPLAYAGHVKTPTLILAHLRDPEVPVSQSYSLYQALRDNGVPVHLVVYPVEGHNLHHDPVHERDTYRRWTDWIEENFRAP
jgi:dipeptidyl aminopeptidase/acylaminoacyl peptidase